MTSLSAPLQSVIDIFQGPLAGVRFADVDAAGLASLAAEVDNAATAVAQQEAHLSALRQTLAERQDALLVLAHRAVAYARVYCEQDDALTKQLAGITLPRAAKPRKPGAAKMSISEPSAPPEVAAEEKARALPPTAGETNEIVTEAPSPSPRKTQRRRTTPRDAEKAV